MSKTRRQHILDAAADLAGALFYYDRKDDDELPRGEVEAAIKAGEVTLDDITAAFVAAAKRNIPELR